MTDTVTISEPITSVTVSDSVTSVTISSSTPSYDVTITNGAAFTAALNDLTDVTLTSPSNNQVLAYNSSTSQWINSTAAGGGGSVTSVSVVTTNGISGTVATSTTTPSISLSLGAITPSTINTNSIQFDTEASRSFLLREETQFTGYTPYTLGLSYNDSGADTTSAFILYGGGGDTMDLWVYDGSCWFGNNGSGNAPDTRLYRSAANTLRTDDSFIVDGSLTSSTLAVSSANATISGYLRVGSNTAPNNTVAGDITGVRLSLGNSAFGTDQIFRIASTLVSTANGAISFATFDPTFSPTANSLTDFRTLNFGARVSTSSGITMDNIEGIHVEGARFGATADGQVASIGGLFGQGVVTDTTATSNISVTSVYGIKGMAGGKGSGSGIITSTSMYGGLFGVTESASTMVTTNGFGIAVVNPASGTTVTNLYGIDVAGQTRGSTGNFGIRVGLSSGATTNAAIQLSDTTGVVGGGILFGTDTTLYRSAADTLKTDDAFIANTVTLLSDDAYSSSWNGSLAVATKNAIYDKIETLTSGASNSFATIAVSGQSDVVADSSTDTLTLVAGSNITITTDASTDTITITGTGGGSGITRSVNVISSPTTAGSTAATDYVYFVSGTTTLTLPTAVGNTNRYTVKNTGSNTVTIATTSSQTIDGSATASLPVANTSLDLVSDGSNWQVV